MLEAPVGIEDWRVKAVNIGAAASCVFFVFFLDKFVCFFVSWEGAEKKLGSIGEFYDSDELDLAGH
jgi:hypothetical protein